MYSETKTERGCVGIKKGNFCSGVMGKGVFVDVFVYVLYSFVSAILCFFFFSFLDPYWGGPNKRGNSNKARTSNKARI